MSNILTKDGDLVEWDSHSQAKALMYDTLIKFFHDTGCYNGETIWQCDRCMEQAPEVLTKLAEEVFKFEVTHEYLNSVRIVKDPL